MLPFIESLSAVIYGCAGAAINVPAEFPQMCSFRHPGNVLGGAMRKPFRLTSRRLGEKVLAKSKEFLFQRCAQRPAAIRISRVGSEFLVTLSNSIVCHACQARVLSPLALRVCFSCVLARSRSCQGFVDLKFLVFVAYHEARPWRPNKPT